MAEKQKRRRAVEEDLGDGVPLRHCLTVEGTGTWQ